MRILEEGDSNIGPAIDKGVKMNQIKLPSIDCEQVADEIGDFIIKQCEYHTGAVIGISGGVDSALVAFLAKRAFDKQKWIRGTKKNTLSGYYISTQENGTFSARLAKEVADILEIKLDHIDISESVEKLRNNISCPFDCFSIVGITKQNLISRLRSNVLWTLASIENKIVLGTGNSDEDFGVGYYTLGGDGLVSCSPIGMLSKRLVYQLAAWIGVPDQIINRQPTAELSNSQTDESDLGYSYALVEIVMEYMRQRVQTTKTETDEDYAKFISEAIKNGDPTTSIGDVVFHPPHKTLQDAIIDVLKRHKGAIYKQKIVNPPIAKITLKYGGE